MAELSVVNIAPRVNAIDAFLERSDAVSDCNDYFFRDKICSREAEKIKEALLKNPMFQSSRARFTYDSRHMEIRITRDNPLINVTSLWFDIHRARWHEEGKLTPILSDAITTFCGVESKHSTSAYPETITSPNYCILPWSKTYPSIVIESAFTQPLAHLEHQKEIWKLATNGETKVVIFGKFSKSPRGTIMGDVYFHRMNDNGIATSSKYGIFPTPKTETPQFIRVSVGEIYGGTCPRSLDPDAELMLSISKLRSMCQKIIRGSGMIPDEI
ncbi:hypothetical protein TWF718_002257 [Orbilia javanica]|uniref:Uncharacterized protein n=1 Tax=Orbilia javanica TaxID=47235 RepID=A0AAN8R8L7_9PEZI